MNGDAIRLLPQAQAFVKAADSAKKPIAVICHGTWLPVSAGIIKGRNGDELAESAGRHPQRGRHMGRSGSGGRQQPDFEPQAR